MAEKENQEKPEEQLTEDESTFPESLLEFQIEKKEAAIDQVLFYLKQMEKKNKAYHERNDLMKKDQEAHIRRILMQMKKEEKEQDEKEVVTRDCVEEALKEMWQYVKDKEQLLKDLHSQIEETEQKLSVKQREREYKIAESKIQLNRIMNLEKDIKEVKDKLHRASVYYSNALKALKEENDRLVERHAELSKEQAIENALQHLDKYSCREIEENEWLKEEVKLYQNEVNDLKASVQLLEEENIGLVAKRIDDRLQNLRVPRHLFPTQAAGLQDEFPKDEMKETEYKEYTGNAASKTGKADGDESLRSATVPYQKNKAFAKLQPETENEKPQGSDEELWEKSFTPTLDSLLYTDEKDFQEYLKLDPLETQLLCVVGRAMPIHEEPEEMSSRSHKEDGITGKSEGRITAKMIKALPKEKVG